MLSLRHRKSHRILIPRTLLMFRFLNNYTIYNLYFGTISIRSKTVCFVCCPFHDNLFSLANIKLILKVAFKKTNGFCDPSESDCSWTIDSLQHIHLSYKSNEKFVSSKRQKHANDRPITRICRDYNKLYKILIFLFLLSLNQSNPRYRHHSVLNLH